MKDRGLNQVGRLPGSGHENRMGEVINNIHDDRRPELTDVDDAVKVDVDKQRIVDVNVDKPCFVDKQCRSVLPWEQW